MKTVEKIFFLTLIVAVSAGFGQNEIETATPSDSTGGSNVGNRAFMPDTTTQKSTGTVKPTIKSEAFVMQDISTGTALSVTGGAVFTAGAVMTLTALISSITNASYESAVMANKTGTIGTILMAIGPIPSCAGASIVSAGLEDYTTDAPVKSYWGDYGTGWGLEVVSVAASALAYYLAYDNDDSGIGIILLAIGANAAQAGTFYYWGKAAWGPVHYITRTRRLVETQKIHFSFKPMYNFRGDAGMCLNVDF